MDPITPAKSNTQSAKLIFGDKETVCRISPGTIGPWVIDIAKLYQDTVHVRPRLHVDGELRVQDYLHRRR